MKFVRLGCEGYKPFREGVEISPRPLTILFGKNNSGKTALLRLARLVLRALSSRARSGFPLDVDEISFGRTFLDLVHQRFAHGKINFTLDLEDDGTPFDLKASVQNILGAASNPDYQIVSRLEIASLGLLLEWEGTRDRPAHYAGSGAISFSGLLPDKVDLEPASPFLDYWRTCFSDFEDNISHLGAQRAAITYSYDKGALRPLGLDGAGATGWLEDYPQLIEAVGDWYEKHMDGWRLSVTSAGSAFHCVLQRGQTEVNLAEAGQGMQQVLPVIVQQLRHRMNEQADFLDLVEEPELHLHPAAHAPLADLFLDTAQSGQGQVWVETHSENLLLRVRRRIAEGVRSDLVAVYWIEDQPDGSSSVRPIRIDADGSVDYWPPGVFSEGYQEAKALSRAARQHG